MKVLSSLFLVVLLLVSQSCSKNEERFDPYTDAGQVENLFNKVDDLTEAFVINPTLENQIVTANNVVIEIPANTIVDQSDITVVRDIKVKIKDLRNSYQTLMTRSSMKIGSNSFKANSVFYIEFVDLEDTEMKVKDGSSVVLYIPLDENLLMNNNKLFAGEEDQFEKVTWKSTQDNDDRHNLSLREWQLNTGVGSIFGKGYIYNIWKAGWYGVGKLMDDQNYNQIDVCIELPELFNPDNTKVFFIHENLISIVHLQTSEEYRSAFCGNVAYDESNNDYTLISLSVTEDNEYYLGIIENPNLSTTTFKLTPKLSNIETIQNLLTSR